jgi:hypothetical protein
VADATQTIRELLTGFSSMMANVGLLPNAGSQGGFGGPLSQGFQAPPTKHPGQVAQELADQMRQQVQVATQQTTVQNQFAQDFTQRLQQIQQAYIPPQMAQYMATLEGRGTPTMGLPGPGGIPSPIFQTPAAMGLYRPNMQANQLYAPGAMMQPQVPPAGFNAPMPAPFIPQPYMPLFPGGPYLGSMLPQIFGGQAPLGRFGEPWQREQMQQETMGNRAFAQAMAVTPTMVGTIPGGLAGGAIGARIGARGGLRGAAIGGAIGLIGGGAAGGYAAEATGLTRIGEAAVEPIVRTRAFGQQLEDMTRQFVVSGPELHPLGRGLGQRQSVQLAERMQRMVEQGQMSEFNMRDVMRITNVAGQRGMLDMAQSGEQIATQVRNVARAVRQFMMIVETPDVQQAMQAMASMRQMGLTVPETMVAARNAQQFARMAGTTTQALMATAGAQGGFMFQQQGLTAGLGMQVGMAATGGARQAIAAGAFTPQQLALASGQQGLAQTMMEGQAATLNMRYPLMAMLTRNEQGQLTVDPHRMGAVIEGRVSMAQQASMAATNISRLAQQGGISQERVISEFTSRQRELADELGRRAGPRMEMLFARQAMQINQEFGGQIGLSGGLRLMGMPTQRARDLEIQWQNPEYWQGRQRQMLIDIPRQRQEEAARREAIMSAGGARNWLAQSAPGRAAQSLRGAGGLVGETWHDIRGGLAEWWSGGTDPSGAVTTEIPEHLRIQNPETTRALSRMLRDDQTRTRILGPTVGMRALAGGGAVREAREGRELSTTSYDPHWWMFGATDAPRGQAAMTGGERWSATYAAAKEASIILPFAGIGRALAVGAGVSMLPEATAVQQAPVVRGARARGGVSGLMAEYAPGLYASAMEAPFMGGRRAKVAGYAAEMDEAGRTMTEALMQTPETRAAHHRALVAGLTEALGRPATPDDEAEYERIIVAGLLAKLNDPQLATESPTDGELKQWAIDALVSARKERGPSQNYVNKNWDHLRAIIKERAYREGGKSAQAKLTKQQAGQGQAGFLAARSHKEVLEKSKALENETRKRMGGGTVIDRISRESQRAFAETAIQTQEKTLAGGKQIDQTEMMLIRTARTLQAQDRGDEANRILAGVRERLGKQGIGPRDIENAITGAQAITGEGAEAARVFGTRLAGMSTGAQRSEMGRVVDEGTTSRLMPLLSAGAARLVEQGKAGGRTREELIAAAIRQPKGALAQRLLETGNLEGGKSTFGGPGVGGKDEIETRGAVDRLGQFAKEIAPSTGVAGAVRRLITGEKDTGGGGLGGLGSKDIENFRTGAEALAAYAAAKAVDQGHRG